MSQTQTQTLRRSVINPTRNHDYLYDQHYTLSSERDHARATYKAHTKVERVNTDPVPNFISRRWRGYAEQNREALIRYTTFNYDPNVTVPPKVFANPEVGGRNRYRYFKRPIIPFLQQVPPEVLLQPTTVDPLAPPDNIAARPKSPLLKNVEIQTDYRDSEAQTDPYSPEYVVRPGSAPELLTLATLSFGHGLPSGLAEVEMIERARAKRAWEKTLPPLNDVSQLDKRRKMMDEMERKEWSIREAEIEKLQDARLEVLKRLLIQRDMKQQELNNKRLDKLWSQKQQSKDEEVEKIRKEHIKTLRKLKRKRNNVERRLDRPDVVTKYQDYASQVYAPMARIGVFLDRGSEQYVVKSKYLDTFQGLLELEASLPEFISQPRIRPPKRSTPAKDGFVKRKDRRSKELAEIHKAIKIAKQKGKEPSKPLRFLQKVEKPIPRPPTPTVEVPSDEVEETELAAILLQKVLRGRSVQNLMYEGKEKRLELIKEVRSTHALQHAEQQMKRQEKHDILTLQRQQRFNQQKEGDINEVLSALEGETLGDMLDFLSKELIRLEEERRIHAFSMLAERRRRIREAEESGRRQVEQRRRREEDEIFKQVLKVHQSTVDSYLEDVILGAVDKTADEQARHEIQEYAEKINNIAYEIEDKRTLLQSEEIVSELVHSFLLPEVLKVNAREKVRKDQRKHLLAAHRIVHNTVEPIITRKEQSSDKE